MDSKGSMTVELAIVLPIAILIFCIVSVAIYGMAVRVELEYLVADVVDMIAAQSTLYNMRSTDALDVQIAKKAILKCYSGGLMDEEKISVESISIPYAGEGECVEIAVSYDLKYWSGVLDIPRAYARQRAWIDQRISIDDLRKEFLSHVYTWATSRQGIEESEGPDDDSIVYVTDTGAKYHRIWCNCLKFSSCEVLFAEALKKGYSPCEFCVLMTADMIGYPLSK